MTKEVRKAYRHAHYLANIDRARACMLAWRAANAEKENARKQVRRKSDPDKHRAAGQKRKYGITPEVRQSLLAAQGHRCAICRREFSSALRTCTDHCHATGRVRGFLCISCNVLLGHAKDSVETLSSAIRYLTR